MRPDIFFQPVSYRVVIGSSRSAFQTDCNIDVARRNFLTSLSSPFAFPLPKHPPKHHPLTDPFDHCENIIERSARIDNSVDIFKQLRTCEWRTGRKILAVSRKMRLTRSRTPSDNSFPTLQFFTLGMVPRNKPDPASDQIQHYVVCLSPLRSPQSFHMLGEWSSAFTWATKMTRLSTVAFSLHRSP